MNSPRVFVFWLRVSHLSTTDIWGLMTLSWGVCGGSCAL